MNRRLFVFQCALAISVTGMCCGKRSDAGETVRVDNEISKSSRVGLGAFKDRIQPNWSALLLRTTLVGRDVMIGPLPDATDKGTRITWSGVYARAPLTVWFLSKRDEDYKFRGSETKYDDIKHRMRSYVATVGAEAVGDRSYAEIAGGLAGSNSGGGGSPGQGGAGSVANAPDWYSLAMDIDIDVDSDRDGKIETDNASATGIAEDNRENDKQENPTGALVGVGSSTPLAIRRLMGNPKPGGEKLENLVEGGLYLLHVNQPQGNRGRLAFFYTEGTTRKEAIDDRTLQLVKPLWNRLLAGEDVTLEMEGEAPGSVELRALLSVKPKGHTGEPTEFTDSVRITVVRLELTASAKDWFPHDRSVAATTNQGSPQSPRTLLVSRDTARQSGITLKAFSDAALDRQDFDGEVTWTLDAVGVHDHDGEFDGGGTTAKGDAVVFHTTTDSFYRFRATTKSYSNTIDVYVASLDINEYPQFIFANASGKVPFGFRLFGAERDGSQHKVEINPASKALFHWSITDDDTRIAGASMMPLDRYAPTWEDTASKNGTSASYKVVSESAPASGVLLTNAGVTLKGSVRMNIGCCLVLPDEKTNYATISGSTSPTIGFADKRYTVVEIGLPRTLANPWVTCQGEGRFEHLASDDNNFSCPGFSIPDGHEGTFKAGDDEKYDDASEKHYHTSAPRGFDKFRNDVACAQMTRAFFDDGVEVTAELRDGEDLYLEGSDDEEEYVAKILGASITTYAIVSYRAKFSSHFGNYYDLGATGCKGRIAPTVLGQAQWHLTTSTSAHTDATRLSSTTLDTAGFVAATAGGLAVLASAPVWVGVGITAVGVGISSATMLNDFTAWDAHYEQQSMAACRMFVGVTRWNSGPLEEGSMIASEDGYIGSAVLGFDERGVWAIVASQYRDGYPVGVGDFVRTGFQMNCSAQNQSYEYETSSVKAVIRLERSDFLGKNDLRVVKYEWRD